MKDLKRTAIKTPVNISITGHRRWSHPNREMKNLFEALDKFIEILDLVNIDRFVFLHGCAVGVDLWFGYYARVNGLPFDLYLPFNVEVQLKKGKFTDNQKKELLRQLEEARNVTIVNKRFHTYGYEKRNRVMIDASDLLLTYFTRSRSGSGNALRYAVKTGKMTIDLRRFFDKSYLSSSIHDIQLLLE